MKWPFNRNAGSPVSLRRRPARVVFCPNQVTVTIARGLAKHDGQQVHMTVIYWPDRCDVSSLLDLGVPCIPYSRGSCLGYLCMQRWRFHVEACLPHRKLGRVVNWFADLCSSTALVDDGLDALRERPQNVDPTLFEPGTRFYTFNYEFPLGLWLENFALSPVADIGALAEVSRESANLRGILRVVVESPPLGRIADRLHIDQDDTALVVHSNTNKRVVKGFHGLTIKGAEVALERSLRTFTGEVVVGESMVAVYLLLQPDPSYRMVVWLAKENKHNLVSLIRLIESCDFAELNLC